MESSLSRRFSNYTLETNQPEHCFLISRTKQWCMVWRAPGGHISVSNPARSAFREPPSSPPSPHLPDQTNRFPGDHRCTPARERSRRLHPQSQWMSVAFEKRCDCLIAKMNECLSFYGCVKAEERSPNPF